MTTADRAPAVSRGRWLAALERGAGWPTTLAVTAVAALLRLPALGRPTTLVFDETYYVKDGWTLATLGYEAQWPPEPNPAFEAGLHDSHLSSPAFVVHPQVGKWVIGAGMRMLGADDPVGWRLGVAVAGLVLVALVVRVGRRLLGSTALGALAGLLVALDGLAVALSRTALLDGILATLVVAAFASLLVDRDRTAAVLADRLSPPDLGPDGAGAGLGPGLGLRPWRLLGGILLGLAVGTKWSALWFVAAFGLLSVGWDAAARRRAGVRRWWQAALLRDAPAAFASLVVVAAAVYTATWAAWFATPASYGRQWAASLPGGTAVTDALASWWHYHGQVWRFHTTLEADHAYRSHPVGWLVQWRPTSFLYESPEPAGPLCGAERCSQAVTSLGNPFVWWFATAALVAVLWLLVRRRRAARPAVTVPLLVGVAAGWLPWFLYPERPVFTFYAIVVLPFLALLGAWAVDGLLAWSRDDDVARRSVLTALVLAGVLVVAAAVFFWPVWTGQVIPFRSWQLHQWLGSWV